jgi:hypothetical protein
MSVPIDLILKLLSPLVIFKVYFNQQHSGPITWFTSETTKQCILIYLLLYVWFVLYLIVLVSIVN